MVSILVEACEKRPQYLQYPPPCESEYARHHLFWNLSSMVFPDFLILYAAKMVDLYSALRNLYFSLSARYEDNMGVSCNKHPNIIIIFMHRLLLLHKGLWSQNLSFGRILLIEEHELVWVSSASCSLPYLDESPSKSLLSHSWPLTFIHTFLLFYFNWLKWAWNSMDCFTQTEHLVWLVSWSFSLLHCCNGAVELFGMMPQWWWFLVWSISFIKHYAVDVSNLFPRCACAKW